MNAKIEVFEDKENRGSYFIQGATGELSALALLEREYPEIKGLFLPKHARSVFLSKCLDCESFWINEDEICGDCGEMRLSKRQKHAYYFNGDFLSNN